MRHNFLSKPILFIKIYLSNMKIILRLLKNNHETVNTKINITRLKKFHIYCETLYIPIR